MIKEIHRKHMWLTLSLGYTGWYEDKQRAKKYDYKAYFDLEIVPRLRVKHNKGDWSVIIAWLCFQLSLNIIYPVIVWEVCYTNKDGIDLCYDTYNLRKAIWMSVRHGFCKIKRLYKR